MWGESLLRVTAAFLCLLVCSRLLGKKLVSHMTFFDFIAGVTFGAIGGNLIFNRLVPLRVGLLNLACFTLLVLLSDIVALKSERMRRLFEGRQLIVIQEGRILRDKLKDARLSIHDLLMLLRKKDVFYPDEVETAVLETDGSVTVLKRGGLRAPNRSELRVDAEVRHFPYPCIMDGKIIAGNLKAAGRSEAWLLGRLQSLGLDAADVLLAQADRKGRLVVETSSGPVKS